MQCLVILARMVPLSRLVLKSDLVLQTLISKPAHKGKNVLQPSATTNVQQGRAIEEVYQKKSQLEHILLRPDTYIGSTERKEDRLWVHDGEQLVQQDITYAPGLYKIFDEILVNAADNKVRDPRMDTLKVDISAVRPQSKRVNLMLLAASGPPLLNGPGGQLHLCMEQWRWCPS